MNNKSRNELGLPPVEQAISRNNRRRQQQSRMSDHAKTLVLIRLILISSIIQLVGLSYWLVQLFTK